MSITTDIKDFALDIGYSKVGITSADDFQNHIDEVLSRGDIYDYYHKDPRQLLKGARPKEIMPSARSIISLAWDYAEKSFPESLQGKVGRVYQARCYMAPPSRINGARFQLMLDFLTKIGCEIGKGIFLPERQVAARAGVITYGKNTFAYTSKNGSFILLSSIVVDKELEDDAPTYTVKCPKDCTACMDACPTGAIYEPMKLNPRKCIAFNSFTPWDGARPLITSHIPPEIREKMGTRVHGCDACQEACPRNSKKLKTKYPDDMFLVKLSEEFSLAEMLEMPDGFYERTIHPIMYNYIKDKKYLRRNAAIALGNTGNSEHIPVLARAMEDTEEIVREYSAWALGKIGGPKSKSILESSLRKENSSTVVDEIKASLGKM
jgi:epoxyqueuosine reductase